MRRFLLCAGLDGNAEALVWLRRLVDARRPDGVLFAGGIVNPGRACAVKLTPWSLSAADTAFVQQFFAALGGLGVFCAVIPGPAGEPLDEFYRLAVEAELAFPNVHFAHATLVAEDGLAVCGLGGDISEEPLLGFEGYTRGRGVFPASPVAGRAVPEGSPAGGAAARAARRPGGQRAGWGPDRQLPPRPVRGGRRERTSGQPAGGEHAGGQPRPPRGRVGGVAGLGAPREQQAGIREPGTPRRRRRPRTCGDLVRRFGASMGRRLEFAAFRKGYATPRRSARSP